MMNAESMTGTPVAESGRSFFKIEGKEDIYYSEAEVPVTNIYRDEILEEDKLPIYLVAISCFRSEADLTVGCAGSLIRQLSSIKWKW